MQVVTVTRTNLKLDTEAKGQKRGIQFGPAPFRQMLLLTFTTMSSTVVISGPTESQVGVAYH